MLDTHTFLWFITANPKLSNSARLLIEDIANKRLLSIASLWEITIKASQGKLKLSIPFTDLVTTQIQDNAISLLPIMSEHLKIMFTLPFYHKDPFDRLLIAQAIAESIPIITKDAIFQQYDNLQVIW
ncbi:type II toxin-antitoxin system VapC family toxin [Candidatus Marithioploca araucensis]|uniref:Type II toxin-antitoxin system VapC family toxin n=1 Tax=Candidatus Marithioploca araucensis TaxID=70273 RepID=A0ABT7VUJ5_9GAMM|nr:type II toxin-antitoxin system VapC family toxin [Candidatus Marithioploca araucensis]